MAVRVQVVAPSFDLALDLETVAREAAEGMRDHWAGQLDKGKQPDGSPLPLNKENKPLGKGRGTLVRGWKVRKAGSTKTRSRAAVLPYTTGKYAIAVRQLRRRGLVFQSLQGESGIAWEKLADAITAKALATASKRKPTKAWVQEEIV